MISVLIKHLQNPNLYDHSVKYFRLIETHISIVILTGHYAYKIKKPLNMEFLDYSTLEKRKQYCYEELRINQTYAPDIYLEVVSVTGSEEHPEINGPGQVIEYAVKMREFPQEQLFSNLIQQEKLTEFHFMKLADVLSSIHQKAVLSEPASHFGTPPQIFFPVQQNFDQIRPLLKNAKDHLQLEKCERWANQEYQTLTNHFIHRKENGFIRRCHGDLHLGNIVLYHDKSLIFDAIEFNPELEWTDVMADVGFLTMDLLEKNHSNFAIAFLNQYLTLTGDYAGLSVLRFYQAYRAVVRAKINIMGFQQNENPLLMTQYYQSMGLAQKMTETPTPRLLIMFGVAGSGKTTKARMIAQKYNAIHLRSDVERKRILTKDFYTEENIEKIYDHLLSLTSNILKENMSVVIDATFLKKSYRYSFMKLASELGFDFHIVPCEISESQRAQWLSQRVSGYSDADIAVAKSQETVLEPLTLEEKQKIL